MFVGISFVICNMYLVWLLVNVLRSNNTFIWVMSIPASLFLAYQSSHFYSHHNGEVTKHTKLLYLIFFLLLGGVALYYLEPLFRYPFSTIGIPFKDMQDAMAVYISDYGNQPSNAINSPTTKFITNVFFTSHQPYYQNIYFGYPNVLHSFSALLIKLGVFEFHATWIATLITILTTSCSLFLILKSFKKTGYSSVVAGLFGLSSFRIPYAIIASIVMAFSIGLIIPVFLIVLVTLYHYKDKRSYILPLVSLSLLAASFTNAIAFLIGILCIYAILLFIHKQKSESMRILKIVGLFFVTIPFFITLFSLIGSTYFGGTFHAVQNNVNFDPYELSQRILPFDKPIYMIFLTVSLLWYAYNVWRKKCTTEHYILQNFLFIVNIGLLIPIFYDVIFHNLSSIKTADDLIHINPSGLFGGLIHFLMHRVALLQPIFFIFFIGDLFSSLKGKLYALSIFMLTLVLLFSLVLKTNGIFYENIQNELLPSFYNAKDGDKRFTFLSHWRLITDEKMWNKDIITALKYLKLNITGDTRILLLDRRDWSEETIANWGSALIRNKISVPKEKGIGEGSYTYVLFIQNRDDINKNAPPFGLGERVFSESGITLFKIH